MKTKYRNVTIAGDRVEGEKQYEPDGSWFKFRASLRLMIIHEAFYGDATDAVRIWSLQDGYGEPGYTPAQGIDWSGVRDSSERATAAMYDYARRRIDVPRFVRRLRA